MKPDAYMKLYIGDWLKKTMHLDATATGAYFLLVMSHWSKPGIPCSDQSLMTTAKVRPQDWARVKEELKPFFTEENGLWKNDRCLEEYDEACSLYSERVSRIETARLVNPKVNPDIRTKDNPEINPTGTFDYDCTSCSPSKDVQLPDSFGQLSKSLSALFMRRPGQPMSYEEQRLLLEICNTRSDCVGEFNEIASLRSKDAAYFPQSMESLLYGWTKVLDRSRNYTPPPVPGRQKSASDTAIDKVLADVERLKRKAEARV
jgi:uncharacterized protein YdaU (DUF1376 family)